MPQRITTYARLTLTILSLAVLVAFSNSFVLRAWAAEFDPPCDPAMSVYDCEALYGGWPNWIPDEAGINVCATSDVTLTGSDNLEKAWNFFKSKGLANVTVAAIFGNLMHESHMNPIIIEGGGTSQDPNDAGSGGWGIAQWTPGGRITKEASTYNITTPIYELGTQLAIVWEELNGIAPTGQRNVLDGLKKQTDLTAAVTYFELYFEAPANPAASLASRVGYAEEGLRLYGGNDVSISAADPSPCGAANSVDCTDAAGVKGVAKILCEAKKYDPVSYKLDPLAGHQGATAWKATCPTIDASCYLDCSGLVNLALYDAFGVDLRQNTYAELADRTNWKVVTVDEAQPGDLLFPNRDHVEIIDHVSGDLFYTFGAHNASLPQKDQVGEAAIPYHKDVIMTILHYIGPT